MKKKLFLFLYVPILACFLSCEDNIISIPQSSYDLLAAGGDVFISINAKSSFEINIPESEREWLQIDEKSANGITLSYHANVTDAERSVKISIISEDEVKYITLKQPIYQVSVTAILFDRETIGLYQKITLSATTNTSDVLNNIKWSDEYSIIGYTNPIVYQPQNIGNNTINAEIEIDGKSKGRLTKDFKVDICDFYFGIWGDDKVVIDKSDDGMYVSGNTFKGNQGKHKDYLTRIYKYENNKLVGGYAYVIASYSSIDNAKALGAFSRFNSLISELSPSFGKPYYGNYSTEMATVDNGNNLLRGYSKYYLKFKNNRTLIEAELRKGDASPYGFTFEIFYSDISK